jgi:hypothetical protein
MVRDFYRSAYAPLHTAWYGLARRTATDERELLLLLRHHHLLYYRTRQFIRIFIVLGTVNLVVTIAGLWIIDNVGQHKAMMAGAA